jgi:predicted Zn-dependent protease
MMFFEPRKKWWLLPLLLVFFISCTTTPITKRKQLILISKSEEIALGLQTYKQILEKARLCHDPKIVQLVNKVGWRIAKAADRPDFTWEFKVIKDDKTANAFCLPGGKVFVYTGILPYTQNEAGLATVISHEVGHVIARHGAERMSTLLLIELGEAGLAAALKNRSPSVAKAFLIAYGLGAEVGILLPYSRLQEYEADHIGLILMAKAGYDPKAAIAFWERMLSRTKKSHIPEFLSTHPTDEKRIAALKQLLPEAMQYYHPKTAQ